MSNQHIGVFVPPLSGICTQSKVFFSIFSGILGGEDLSAAISFWSARCGSNLKGDFGTRWAGWQAGERCCSWLADGGRLAGRRELGGGWTFDLPSILRAVSPGL